jgi:hypothetical protein
MNGVQVVGGGVIGQMTSGWYIAGVGDYNGDVEDGLLLHNGAGATAIWDVVGTQVIGGGTVGTIASPWIIEHRAGPSQAGGGNNEGAHEASRIDQAAGGDSAGCRFARDGGGLAGARTDLGVRPRAGLEAAPLRRDRMRLRRAGQ